MENTTMQRKAASSRTNLFAAVSLLFILGLYLISSNAPGTWLADPKLQLFKTLFISIMLEAMPFILVGVIISALLHVFVSDAMIRRFIPSNPVLGILTATVLGIIFPICECGMVPAIRKLIRRGMPTHVATAFILVGPIINPIVFWSTFTAFRSHPEMAYMRMGLAFAIALIVGLIVYRVVRFDPLRETTTAANVHTHAHVHHHHHDDEHRHDDNHEHSHAHRSGKIAEVMGHAVSEFFDMGKFLLIGALLVGLLQTFVSNTELMALGHGPGSSNALMMALGFMLSLCSTSDAFVAQSFLTTFDKGALLAFMVFGPMLNLKSLLMMLAVFKTKFVLLVGVCVTVLVYVGSLLIMN
ncbi:permease [Paenibacillus glycanilyticus]|uniref:permease n=1 Tax=Paenibacillus glycanilyticus TaxID=126569 RepID=UPI001F1933EE|nr:permease [Paenibacillus glycanilyticus]